MEKGWTCSIECPERGRRLAGQGAAGEVRDGAGHHHRQGDAELGEHRLDAGVGRLGVQRVEDRLNDDEVGAALDQRAGGLGVGIVQLVERHGAEAGVVDVGRDRCRAVGRPERSHDEAAAAVLRLGAVAGGAAQFRRLAVQLRHQRFHPIVGLGDGGRVEGVGGHQIRACLGVGVVDVLDGLRLGQHQQVVVAAQVARPVGEALATELLLGEAVPLDHRAHRAVEHEDLLPRGFGQRVADVVASGGIGHQAAFCSRSAGRMPSRWQIA